MENDPGIEKYFFTKPEVRIFLFLSHNKVKSLFGAFSITSKSHPDMSETRYDLLTIERVSRKPNLLMVSDN